MHCDECQNQIVGKIYSCTSCFDYDLCDACYISKRTNHADGKHEFVIEEAKEPPGKISFKSASYDNYQL